MKKKTKIIIVICIGILIGISALIFPLNYYKMYYSITYPKHLSDKSFCNSDSECAYSRACICPPGPCENFVHNKLKELTPCPDIIDYCVYRTPPELFSCKCIENKCTNVPPEKQVALDELKDGCERLCSFDLAHKYENFEEFRSKHGFCHFDVDTTLWGGISQDHCYKEEADFISIECYLPMKDGTFVLITKEVCGE